MDESVHGDRCFWTNCLVGYNGHIRLPRLASTLTLPTLATLSDTGFETWASVSDLTYWTEGGQNQTVQQGTGANKYAGTYSVFLFAANNVGDYGVVYQNMGSITSMLGKYFRITGYCKSASIGGCRIYITTDGTAGTTTYSGYHTGGGGWEQLSAALTLPADATYITIGVRVEQGKGGYFDAITIPTLAFTANPLFCNFNSALYLAINDCVLKLNTGGTGFNYVGNTSTAITDMVSSLNSKMYIAVGNSTKYWIMTTADAFTQATGATSLANWFLQWDDKLQEFRTDGTSFYSVDPDAGGGATWTTYGTVTDIPAAKLRKPVIYQDADGNDIIYWANSISLKAHDAANTKYVDTKCKLSDHPNGAKGCLFWRDGLFLSEGLGIKKYTVGSSAIITDVGLNKDDGLISYYNGEIVKLVEGENEIFALVDASQVTGTNYSGVYAFDGDAWSCWWADGTADEAMYDAIVSTAYGYRLYWIVGSTPTVYYIDLMRGSKNPSQLSGIISYASAGVWISPWFDAGSTNAAKCIKQIASYCKNITTTETVTIKYRTNHTNTDIATGWTTLVTLDTSGENGSIETLLASGAGISVDAIQLRLDLARGSTATNSPDVQAIVVSYLKTLDMKWGWNFTIVADEVYRGQSPAVLISALQTAANSTTLVPFIFRDDATNYTKYVRIESFYGLHGTGHEYIGKYVVSVIEP